MNMAKKREELKMPAEAVIEDGIEFWANDRPENQSNNDEYSPDGRIQRRNEIIKNREEYRELHRSNEKFRRLISQQEKKEDLRMMAGAFLYLCAAGYHDKGVESDLVGDAFNQKSKEVVEFVLEIDEYSILDGNTVSEVVALIEDKDGKLYQLFKEEISDAKGSIQEVTVPSSALENDKERRFLSNKLEDRKEKMNKAVQAYVSKNSVYDILEEFEEAITNTGRAAMTRRDIVESLQEEITGLEEQLQWALRNQRELFITEVNKIGSDLERELLSADELDAQLTDLESELQWAFREHREFLTQELETHSDESIETLTPQEMIALLHEQRDDIIASLEDSLRESQSQIETQLSNLRKKQESIEDEIAVIEESQNQAPREEIEAVVNSELDELVSQRDKLDAIIDRFERERSKLEAEVDALKESPTPPAPVTDDGTEVEGTEVIPASVARLYEQDFIAHIERSLREAAELYVPDEGSVTIEDGYWDSEPRSDRGSYQGNILSELPDDASHRRYPERPWVRYATIESTGFLGRDEDVPLVVEGLTTTRLKTYANHGSDWAPTTLPELHEVVGEAMDRGLSRHQDDAHHLLVIGSPTGWTSRVQEEIKSGSLFDADISVCLVDLRSDEPYFDKRDEVLSNNRWLIRHELPLETIKRCADRINEKYISDPTCERVLFQTAVSELDFSPHIIKRAFDLLEEEGLGVQIETDHGLVLSFD